MMTSRFSFSLPVLCYTFLTLCVLLFCLTQHAQAQTAPDFRKVRWNFSRAQVKELELPNTSSRKGDKLVYKRVSLKDRIVGLDYEFNGDSLLSARYYYYTSTGIKEVEVRAAAEAFEAALREKYGQGKTKIVGSVRERYWITPRTQISLQVGQMDKGWSVEIAYLCRVCYSGPNPGIVLKGEITPNTTDKELESF
jgi:hypothetical protein